MDRSKAARAMGQAKSQAKTSAARTNAKKGGWRKGRARQSGPALEERISRLQEKLVSGDVTLGDNTFAAACYNQNTIGELKESIAGRADSGDLESWGISATEWRSEIELALAAKLSD